MAIDEQRILAALYHSWSIVTAAQWSSDNPARGQCNVTALLVHDMFGGDIHKTPQADGEHFYNRIDGERFDFTSSQFEQPIAYADVESSREEAANGATRHELTTLRQAFEKHY